MTTATTTTLEMENFLQYFVDQLKIQQIQVLRIEEYLDLEAKFSKKAQNGKDWVIKSREKKSGFIMATSVKEAKYPGKNIFLCYWS